MQAGLAETLTTTNTFNRLHGTCDGISGLTVKGHDEACGSTIQEKLGRNHLDNTCLTAWEVAALQPSSRPLWQSCMVCSWEAPRAGLSFVFTAMSIWASPEPKVNTICCQWSLSTLLLL